MTGRPWPVTCAHVITASRTKAAVDGRRRGSFQISSDLKERARHVDPSLKNELRGAHGPPHETAGCGMRRTPKRVTRFCFAFQCTGEPLKHCWKTQHWDSSAGSQEERCKVCRFNFPPRVEKSNGATMERA